MCWAIDHSISAAGCSGLRGERLVELGDRAVVVLRGPVELAEGDVGAVEVRVELDRLAVRLLGALGLARRLADAAEEVLDLGRAGLEQRLPLDARDRRRRVLLGEAHPRQLLERLRERRGHGERALELLPGLDRAALRPQREAEQERPARAGRGRARPPCRRTRSAATGVPRAELGAAERLPGPRVPGLLLEVGLEARDRAHGVARLRAASSATQEARRRPASGCAPRRPWPPRARGPGSRPPPGRCASVW